MHLKFNKIYQKFKINNKFITHLDTIQFIDTDKFSFSNIFTIIFNTYSIIQNI